jgi:hypothetical protein
MNTKYNYVRVFDPPPAYRIMNLQNIKRMYRCLNRNYGKEVIRVADLFLTLYRDDLPDLQKRIDTHTGKFKKFEKRRMDKLTRKAQHSMISNRRQI